MENSYATIGEEFVQLLHVRELESYGTAFVEFSQKVIEFIHKPFRWTEKHSCLVRLKAALHNIKIKSETCIDTQTYAELGLSLIATMKGLLLKAQGANPDSLTSEESPFICRNGEPLTWTDGDSGLYEIINVLLAKKAFNNGNATMEDLTEAFGHMCNRNLTAESGYETGRCMRQRKGKVDNPKYSEKNNIPIRDYYLWEAHKCINDKLIKQDAMGDARKNKKKGEKE